MKCNTAFGFYVRTQKYENLLIVSANVLTNMIFKEEQAMCLYCDRKDGELIDNKVIFRAYSLSYNYHSKVNRRCSKAKRYRLHRHQYQIYVDRMERNYPRGKIPAARIDSAEEGQELCRARTPVWLNMTLGNYTTNDGKTYVSGGVRAPCITLVIICEFV